MIAAKNISLSIRGKEILKPLSCRFEKSQFVAVIGPNGAGKSTLLHLLSGLIQPTTGVVDLFNRPAKSWRPEELAQVRAYLQQHHSVFESFTLEDVLLMGRSIHFDYKPSRRDQELVTQILTELNLLHRKDQPFNSLSGGEQQRVQFARTLIQLQENTTESLESKILFLDEPLNNLDLHYQYNLLQMARDKVVDKGGLIIAVLHDLNITAQFADRVIILKNGEVKADAAVEEAMDPVLLSSVYAIGISKKEEDGCPYFIVEQPSMSYKRPSLVEMSYR